MKRILSSIFVAFFFLLNAAAQNESEFELTVSKSTDLKKVEITQKGRTRNQAIIGKKRVVQMFGTDTFWKNTIESIRNRYIPSEKVSKLKSLKSRLEIHLTIDYQGNILFEKLVTDEAVLDELTETCLMDIYREFIGMKIPMPHTIKDTEFVEGFIYILDPHH